MVCLRETNGPLGRQVQPRTQGKYSVHFVCTYPGKGMSCEVCDLATERRGNDVMNNLPLR